MELEGHPWFVGCQFHPEYRSKPMHPHPLFAHFIRAVVEYAKRKNWTSQKVVQTTPLLAKKKKARD